MASIGADFFSFISKWRPPQTVKDTESISQEEEKTHRDFCLVLFSFLLTVFLFKSIFECVIWHTD